MERDASTVSNASRSREFLLTPLEFRKIASIAYEETGILLPEAKETLVYARLIKRLRFLGLSSFAEYIGLLSDKLGKAEHTFLISALTTNTTRFNRESHHFEYLAEVVLPPLVAAARRGARVRLWSAACSSGEESYEIAFSLLRLCPEAVELDVKILATDIDEEILALARRGVYSAQSISALPEHTKNAFFTDIKNSADSLSISSEVRALVSFRQMNLTLPWPVKGPFDVIFCRNVAIYFDMETQSKIWQKFSDAIVGGGFLCIGHSERLSSAVRDNFDVVGMTMFRRRSAQACESSQLVYKKRSD